MSAIAIEMDKNKSRYRNSIYFVVKLGPEVKIQNHPIKRLKSKHFKVLLLKDLSYYEILQNIIRTDCKVTPNNMLISRALK